MNAESPAGEGALPPLALYLHVPFCRRKCRYCDFHSRPVRSPPVEAYAAALGAEARFWRRLLPGDDRSLQSIFWGGGTPSLIPAEIVKQVLDQIVSEFPLVPGGEVTLEANPESLTRGALEGYRRAGVNRISLGVQALDDRRLAWLGRPHDTRQAERAAAWIREAGFDRFSLDLIFATPDQELASWLGELDRALAWGPGHLSCYALTLEPSTPLGRRWLRGTLHALEEEREREMLLVTRAHLAAAGLPAYEISNFARPGQACRHNLNYWHFGDYLGMGASSHGKVTQGRVWRHVNLVDEGLYRQRLAEGRPPWWRRRALPMAELASERVIMAMRLTDGLDLTLHARATGQDLTRTRGREIQTLIEGGWVCLEGSNLRLTERGVPLANAVMRALL